MKSQLLGVALAGCVLGQAAGAADVAAPAGDRFGYKTVGRRELGLWVLKPDGWASKDRRPAIVFFHGGGWVGGTPRQFDTQCRYLASRGMVCVQVEYRTLDGKAPGQAATPPLVCCRDARSAMRWVRAHASALGVDPGRIASGGGSAGGHLAAVVEMIDGLDDPADDTSVSARSNAMVLFNPVVDNGPGGYGAARTGSRYKEYSPAHNVSPDDPPAVVFLGSDDRLVPTKTVEDFKVDMRKHGVRCESFIYDMQPHGFFNKEPWRTKTLIETDRFLASLGWLAGPPALKPDPPDPPR